jgi:phage terminase large subunit GpA-like protein
MTTRAPAETRSAIAAAVDAGLAGLESPPPMRLSDWASKHFTLSSDSSQQSGEWVPWRFQVGMLDMMGHDDIHELDVRKAKRVGYTKCLTASIGFDAVHRRRNQAVWQPTDEDRDSFVDTEVKPMLDVPAVARARRKPGAKERNSMRKFKGCLAHFLGGKAARVYRRITVAAAKGDEIDAFDQEVEGSIDPVAGMRGRLEGAPFPKLILGTTPRVKGISHIESREQAADAVMRYLIRCPHCDAEHPLIWGGRHMPYGMKWRDNDPDTVHHVCPHCGAEITQTDYLPDGMTPIGGHWVDDRTGLRYHDDTGEFTDAAGNITRPPRHIAIVDVWTAYSPQREWSDIVREFLHAEKREEMGDSGKMQTFVNETLARCWESGVNVTPAGELAARAKNEGMPARVIPERALVLTAYADTQPDRLEVSVTAWAPGMESHVIDHRVLWGSPAVPPATPGSVWQQLDAMVAAPYSHATGVMIPISAYGIDSGGHNTQDVYNYGSTRTTGTCIVTKGSSVRGKPVIASRPTLQDIDWHGNRVQEGVKLWTIGPDTAKDWTFARIKFESGPGAIHWHATLPDEYFDQFTAERPVQRYVRGNVIREWVKPKGARNEALDCYVGNVAVAHYLSLHQWTPRQWQLLRDTLIPQAYTPDLFADPVPVPVAPVADPAEAGPIIVDASPPETTRQAPVVPDLIPKPGPTVRVIVHPPISRGRRVLSAGIR